MLYGVILLFCYWYFISSLKQACVYTQNSDVHDGSVNPNSSQTSQLYWIFYISYL